MTIGLFLDNLTSFLIDPSNNKRNPAYQAAAWLTTIILGVATLGTVQGISAIWRNLRHTDKNDTHEKIGQLFQDILSKNKTDPTELDKKSSLTIDQPIVQDAPKTSSFKEIAQSLYDNRDALWNAARTESEGNETLVMVRFINKIRSQFKENDKSFSAIVNDEAALDILFQSARLRAAVLKYAEVNKLQNLLDKLLIFVAKNIYANRDNYTNQANQANQKTNGNFTNLLILLTIYIEKAFINEGRSLFDIFSSSDALEIFKKSERLSVVLDFYAKMHEASQKPSDETSPKLEDKQVKDAIRLAKNNAEGPSLVTRIGLKEFQSDEVQLKNGIKKFLLLNPPDKNPYANEELVKDAIVVNAMINNGVYANYKSALEKFRSQ